MNKRFLAIAIAAGLAAPVAVMAEGAEIYGIAHVSVDNVSYDATGSVDDWNVTSRASRVGVKGSEDLGGGLKAVYKMEWEVGMDTANAANTTSRNHYVGLSGGMGTVLLGAHDTPTKMAQGKFDVFNDTAADMKNNGVDGDVRASNVIAYLSPKMGGMQLIVALIPGEGANGNTAPQACTATSPCDGIADATSVSFTYEAGPLYVGFGMDSGDIVEDQMRLAVTYAMDALQVGFLYNARSDDALDTSDNAEDEVAMGLSAKFTMGDGAIKGQFIQLSDTTGAANNNNDDATAITVGYDMNLSSRTTAYALYNMYSPDVSGASQDVNTLSVGIQHSF